MNRMVFKPKLFLSFWAVMSHGIRSWWKDRRSILLGLATPIFLFLLFTLIFSNSEGKIAPLTVGWVDLDKTAVSASFKELLESSGGIQLVDFVSLPFQEKKILITKDNAKELIQKGDLATAIVVLPGFEKQILYFQKWDASFVELFYNPAQEMQADILKGLLTRAGFLLFSQELTQNNPRDEAFAKRINPRFRRIVHDLKTAFEESNLLLSKRKSLGVEESFVPISFHVVEGAKKENFVAAQQMAGVAVMFLLFSVTRAGSILLEEKQSGTLKRILSAPISLNILVLGKLFAVVFNGIAQITAVGLVAYLFFDVPIFRSPLAFFLMVFATAVSSSAFGLFFATFCQTSEQVMSVATFVILAMSLLGGSMVPSFLLPLWAQKFSIFTLNAWAMKGFLKVLIQGLSVSSILPELLVLLGMTALFLGITFSILPRRLYEEV